MDFDFGALFENSDRLRAGSLSPSVEEYFDDFSEDEDYVDSDDEWMAEYRLKSMQQSDKEEFNIGLKDDERQQLIAQGQELLFNTYQRISRLDDKFFKSANLKPIPTDLDVTNDHVSEIEEYFENEYDSEEEIINSSVDPNLLDFKKDSIISSTIKLVRELYDKLGTDEASEFQLKYANFLSQFKGWKYKYHRINFFSHLSTINNLDHKQIILNILNYQEPSNAKLNNVFVVYVPSGGGKTTMFKKYKNFVKFLDVDQFIKENYTSFKIFKDFYDSLDDINKTGLMSLWFKYHLHQHNINNNLQDVIMLFNHPNQLPNYFRKTFNELIIIPSKLNWKTRFFEENIFSLLHVKHKHTVFLEYNYYLPYIISLVVKLFQYNNVRKLLIKQIYGIIPHHQDDFIQQRVQQSEDNVGTKRKGKYQLRDTKPKGSKKAK